ncbi:hypothetical protein PGB90_010362 [Kerria lacca]
MSDRSSYLILGGCGFIGRHFVQYLVDNNLASKIRIADKILPALAYFNEKHETVFRNPIVEFINVNLLNKNSLEKVFQYDLSFDYVINCAGETRYGLTDAIYYEGIVNMTTTCARLAAKYKVKRFVEISSGCMASNSKIPHKESDTTDPWTSIANFKLMSEKSLTTIPDLNYTILRPAIVYGIGDKTGISKLMYHFSLELIFAAPRLVIGSIYKYLKETMKVLWNRNLMMNTVHVHDLCRVICYVCNHDESLNQVYNVVDVGCTTHGIINDFVSEIFNIQTTYVENLITMLYKIDFDSLIEDINDKHSTPWAELCQKSNITNTHLSSFLHKEDLYNKHLYLDGTKLLQLGFTYDYPKITKNLILEILEDYKSRNLFPQFN